MNQTLEKQQRLSQTLSMIAIAMIGLIIALLSVASILQTSRIDPVAVRSEHILFDDDQIWVNLSLIVLTLLGIVVLIRHHIHLSKLDPRYVIFIMLLITTVVSLVWVNQVKSVATGDARLMLNTAKGASQGDYSGITSGYAGSFSYYQYYPSQLGYVFFAEMIYSLFGAEISDLYFQIPNVIALDLAYAGIVLITDRIFKRRAVTNLTAIALAVCLQPMFMTTYTAPLILGLAFAVWSVFFTVRYMQENKIAYAGIAALLIMISVVLRYNNMIMLTAICIALILHAIGAKRLLALAAAAVMVVCSIGAQKLVIHSYSERSGVTLNTEVTPILTTYLGVSESSMAPGWYNHNAITTLSESAKTSEDKQLNNEIAEAAAREKISSRIAKLNESNTLTDFFKKKFLSQFNEPYMESVWVSQTREHDIDEKAGETLPPLVISVYREGLFYLLNRWFPYYTMIIYIGFTAGMVWMLIRRRLSPDVVILPTAVLGGILYHMINEAKSMYFLPYFVLLIPFAMYGLLESGTALHRVTQRLFRSSTPEDTAASQPSSPQP